MTKQFKYSGNYAREFGAHPQGLKRIWKVYDIIHNGEIAGTLTIEPEYHPKRYVLNCRDGEGGSFKTYQEVKSYFR